MIEMVEIGARMRVARGEHGQRQFADLLGIACGTLSNYERGARNPDAGTLFALWECGWSPTWILTGQGPSRVDSQESAEARQVTGSEGLQSRVEALERAIFGGAP